MTREEAITNLEMIRVGFVVPITEEQEKLIDDTFDMAIKALKQEPCEDAISRQAAIDKIEKWLSFDDYNESEWMIMKAVISELRDMPSVTPKQRTGHWILHTDASGNSWHACPACGHIAHTLTRFCPDCGARLEAPS